MRSPIRLYSTLIIEIQHQLIIAHKANSKQNKHTYKKMHKQNYPLYVSKNQKLLE